MPPIPPTDVLPRLITYYQTHHDPSGKPISILPLLMQPGISMTHVILAAIHINQDPTKMTLNDHPPTHERFDTLWAELRVLQASGVKVFAMLGGAAKGTYERLDGSEDQFERYYRPLRDMIRTRGLDGLDLDVEEPMSLGGVIRLIDRLRADFGPAFLITMAPVAAALLDHTKNLSGFDYEALEVMRGKDIAWYNTQFYCNWGTFENSLMYDMMIRKGWPPQKVVVGLVTNPANGPGFVHWAALESVMAMIKSRYGNAFGGIMGWEYFNSLPGNSQRPWEWARELTRIMRPHCLVPVQPPPVSEATKPVLPPQPVQPVQSQEIDPDTSANKDAPVPSEFDYHTDS